MIKNLNFDCLVEKGWLEAEDFLAQSLSQSLYDRLYALWSAEELRPGGIRGTGEVKTSIRNDTIRWIEKWEGAELEELKGIIRALGNELRNELRVPLKSFEAHFSRYGEGGFYKKHIDQHLGQKRRQVTFVMYLNESLGGELALYNRYDRNSLDQTIQPRPGKLALFLSGSIFHEVLASHGHRYAVTGWFRDDLDPLRVCNI